MIEPGSTIKTDFTLNIVENGEEKEVSFNDLLTQPVVVSVYMKNNTSSCDKQNKSLAEHNDEIEKLGYKVIAISKDGCRSHKNYIEKHNLPYTLASDPDYNFSNAVDSVVEKKMYGKTFEGPSRSAFFIDTDGTVQAVIEKVTSAKHGEEVIETIKSIS